MVAWAAVGSELQKSRNACDAGTGGTGAAGLMLQQCMQGWKKAGALLSNATAASSGRGDHKVKPTGVTMMG